MRASFGRGFFKLRGGKQTASDPNLGETDLRWRFDCGWRRWWAELDRSLREVWMFTAEHKGTEHLDLAGVPPKRPHDAPPPSSPEPKKKSRGFRRFFGR